MARGRRCPRCLEPARDCACEDPDLGDGGAEDSGGEDQDAA